MSIFARLFLLIGLVSSVSLTIVAGLLWRNAVELETQLGDQNARTGRQVLQKGTALLEQSLTDTHLMIVREKARRVEAYFSNIADTVQLEAALAAQFLSDSGGAAQAPTLYNANQLTAMARANPALRKTLVSVQPYVIYHPAPGVSEAQLRPTLNRLRRLGAFFAHTQHTVPGCDSTYFGGAPGFILGYPGGNSFFKSNYDARQRPWYKGAIAPGQRPGTLQWIVYTDRDGKTIFLTCSRSVTLPGAARPAGVAAIDVKFPDVLNELFNVGSLNVSKAVLVDEIGRVRVSASYDVEKSKSRPTFDNRNSLTMPAVATMPEFAHVAAHIRQNPAKDADLYWDGKETGKPMADADSVFIYATVRFSTGTTAPGHPVPGAPLVAGDSWRYIVRLPMNSLLKPIRSVSREMQHGTVEISDAIRARTRESAGIVLLLIGATLTVALGVSYIAARGASFPLVQMAAVARGVGEGNLDQQAVETAGGEIGEMGRAINAMISGLRQRNLLKETFSRYTAPTVVEEVLRRGGVQLGGVKSIATIFFSDLAGFTAMAEKMPPEALVALLNEYLDAMTKIVLESEGTLDKYIGDAIVAFWGHPIAHLDDAARACRTALEQRVQLARLCDKWESEGRPRLDMRIGIDTGEVIVGDIGSELKLNYTVLGDTVNFTSRLESVNKIYGTTILIGETTRRLAGDAIIAREIDLLAVVGKQVPVRVFELVGMAGAVAEDRLEGLAHYEAGLRAYRAQDWGAATEFFHQAQQSLGTDRPSEVLLARVEKYAVAPPAADWDGSLVLDQK